MNFCFAFLVILLVAELFRRGVPGIPPGLAMVLFYEFCLVAAVIVLRGRVAFVFRPPGPAEVMRAVRWSWSRTVLLVPVAGAVLWMIPLTYGMTVGALSLRPVGFEALLQAIVMQILIVGLAEEVFFREAALGAWVERPMVAFGISSLAFLVFHLHTGLPQAFIAFGAGLVYGALRLAGAGILGVALLHGVTNIAFSRVWSIGLTESGLPGYAVWFVCATAILAGVILLLFKDNFVRLDGAEDA